MSQQITFFDRSVCDVLNTSVITTISDNITSGTGESFAHYLYNRNNTSAWMTTASADIGLTQLDIDFGQGYDLSDIILVKHNFKAYTIQYWNGSAYVDFSTAISETTNLIETTRHTFTTVETQKIRLIIQGTMIADADKVMRQLLCCTLHGQLNGWPEIKKPTHGTNKKKNTMISGKYNIVEGTGAFQCNLTVSSLSSAADIAILEELYTSRTSKLLWLCGGDESQFNYASKGYRLEDFYLVRPLGDYSPELYKSIYSSGQKINIKLGEVVD